MTLTAANVRVGVTGTVSVAVSGTAVPTTVSGALNAAFFDLGYISEDGVSTSTSTDVNDIKAWQNGTIVRKVQTSHDYTLTFTMLETSEKTLEVYYGNFTHGAGAASGVSQVTGTQGYRGAWVLNVVDGTDLIRIVLPDGQVTEHGDVVYANGDPVGYEITVTAYPDTSGVKAYVYTETTAAS